MTQEAKHTPGPWEVIYGKNGAAVRIEAPNDRGKVGGVGSVVRKGGIGLPAAPVGLANARLMAAAPDLLAVVTTPIPSQFPCGTFADDLFTIAGILEETPYAALAERLRHKAREMLAAITKAEGRTQ